MIYGKLFYFSDLDDKPLEMKMRTLHLAGYLLIICPMMTLSEIEIFNLMIDVDNASYFTLSHAF